MLNLLLSARARSGLSRGRVGVAGALIAGSGGIVDLWMWMLMVAQPEGGRREGA